jgi:hypothetical protein
LIHCLSANLSFSWNAGQKKAGNPVEQIGSLFEVHWHLWRMEEHLRSFINELSEALSSARNVWRHLGSTKEEKLSQSSELFGLLSLAVREFVVELEGEKSGLEVEVELYNERLQTFLQAVDQEPTLDEEELASFPLCTQLEEIQAALEEAEHLAETRQHCIQQKVTQLEMYHFNLDLGEEEIVRLRAGVPPLSHRLIQRLESALEEASACLEVMHTQIKQKRHSIRQLVDDLDWEAPTPQEKQGEPLHSFLDRLCQQEQTLQEAKESRSKKLEAFLCQLSRYTPYLVDDDKWTASLEHVPSNWRVHPLSTALLSQCQTQVSLAKHRFQVLAAQIIEKLRDSINALWIRLSYEPAMTATFRQQHLCIAVDEKLTVKQIECLLEAHEKEETKLLQEAEAAKPILTHIRQRELALSQRQELELRIQNDPNRLKGRGGGLLKEEQSRKRIQKAVEAAETFLRAALPRWEEENCRCFIYQSERFLDVLGVGKQSVSSSLKPNPTDFVTPAPRAPRPSSTNAPAPSLLGKRTALQARSVNQANIAGTPRSTAKPNPAKRARLSHQVPSPPTTKIPSGGFTAPITSRASLSHPSAPVSNRRTTLSANATSRPGLASHSRRVSQFGTRPRIPLAERALERPKRLS